MEPFGLLNLLSALLPQTEQNPSAQPSPPPSPEPTPSKPHSPPEPPPSQTVNACAEFLEAHDKRIQQTKK